MHNTQEIREDVPSYRIFGNKVPNNPQQSIILACIWIGFYVW